MLNQFLFLIDEKILVGHPVGEHGKPKAALLSSGAEEELGKAIIKKEVEKKRILKKRAET